MMSSGFDPSKMRWSSGFARTLRLSCHSPRADLVAMVSKPCSASYPSFSSSAPVTSL